jgi:hypothetical protein
MTFRGSPVPMSGERHFEFPAIGQGLAISWMKKLWMNHLSNGPKSRESR